MSNPIRWGSLWFAFFIRKVQEKYLNNSKNGKQNTSPGDHNGIIYQALVIRADLHRNALNLVKQNGAFKLNLQ